MTATDPDADQHGSTPPCVYSFNEPQTYRRSPPPPAPPPPWQAEFTTPDGQTYYYNKRTDMTQWEHPLDDYHRSLFEKLRYGAAHDPSMHINTGARTRTHARARTHTHISVRAHAGIPVVRQHRGAALKRAACRAQKNGERKKERLKDKKKQGGRLEKERGEQESGDSQGGAQGGRLALSPMSDEGHDKDKREKDKVWGSHA